MTYEGKEIKSRSGDYGNSFEIKDMEHYNPSSLRFQADPNLTIVPKVIWDETQIQDSTIKMTDMEELRIGKSLKDKVLCRVFSEDFGRVKTKILDPRGTIIRWWSRIFLIACLFSLFLDPLFLYLPAVSYQACIENGMPLAGVILTVIRSLVDIFYIIQIFLRFRTAYVAPPSRVLGRGELVIDSRKIALRYLRLDFWIDFIAALPLPQVLIWLIAPNLKEIVKDTSVLIQTAWTGAAYNMLLYILVGHVIGAWMYYFSIERLEGCWKSACDLESACQYDYFDCKWLDDSGRNSWFQSTNVTNLCNVNGNENYFQCGMYASYYQLNVLSTGFFNKFFYSFWFGLQNLNCFGQNLNTSTFVGENNFAIFIGTLSLILFAWLIANMQRYLQSTTVRIEEWRINRNDMEKWMHHRQLPHELRESIRKYDTYKWLATGGVDEEAILNGLPLELRRDIKRHLCLDLVRQVPLFYQMDERMLDAIIERLKPALSTEGTFLVREGDPVNVMLFIIRGYLDSYTTDGGRVGFFNFCRLGPGDFCGEELLTWALDPHTCIVLPSSTRTAKAVTAVEAFSLRAEDLKFVASHFRRLHSKQLRHKFRFHSHQWRTWAACFIQASWRRYRKRKEEAKLRAVEKLPARTELGLPGSGFSMYATILEASSRMGVNLSFRSESSHGISLKKPAEPDFFDC
ncbi:hypothetical protein SLE2022_285570 [Rubroshorea leprosula]